MRPVDFDQAPFLVIWETTQACELACRHCRASAQPDRHPGELTTAEGVQVLEQVAAMGTQIVVLSGGDPASRPDLVDLVRAGKGLGLRMATIPAATPRLGRDLLVRLKEVGLDQIAFSLDQPRAEWHDEFRRVPGAFAKTMDGVRWAHEVGLPLQINSTLCADTLPHLQEMSELVDRLGIVFWEVFFLVPMGRGAELSGLSAQQCEDAFALLHRVQSRNRFVVKVTEAPHYRRYAAQQEGPARPTGRPDGGHPGGHPNVIGLAHRGVNAGSGFLFVSHLGEVYPSGFLPIPCGNVRTTTLADAYRNSPLLQSLRDPDRLLGRCGRCEYRVLCGGSRSRAFALTGSPLETDPWCGYLPAGVAASHPIPV